MCVDSDGICCGSTMCIDSDGICCGSDELCIDSDNGICCGSNMCIDSDRSPCASNVLIEMAMEATEIKFRSGLNLQLR
jgi:hypothetical protein